LPLEQKQQREGQCDLRLDHRERPTSSGKNLASGSHGENLSGQQPGAENGKLAQRKRGAIARNRGRHRDSQGSRLPTMRREFPPPEPRHGRKTGETQRLQNDPRHHKISRPEKRREHRKRPWWIHRVGLGFHRLLEPTVRINAFFKFPPLPLADAKVAVAALPGHTEPLGQIRAAAQAQKDRQNPKN
jgi:hypothetical protein